jgi:hypothetical protein
MRITAPEIAMLAVIAAGLVISPALNPVLAADETPFASLAKLATALSENDVDSALGYFDSHMKNYAGIEQKIEALTAQSDISCAIDVVEETEADGVHKLDLDWFIQLTNQTDSARLERRRERVQVEMRQFKNVWKITSISSVTILDPMQIK